MVLSRGNTEDYAQMYRDWAGHDPSIQPYLDYYGLSGGARRAAAADAPAAGSSAAAAPAPQKGERGDKP